MSYSPVQLIAIAENFSKLASDTQLKNAKKTDKKKKTDSNSAKDSKKDSKKTDPKKDKKKKSAIELLADKLEARSNKSNYYDRLISKFADEPNMSVEPEQFGPPVPNETQTPWLDSITHSTNKPVGQAAKPATRPAADPQVSKLQTLLRDKYKLTGKNGKALIVDGLMGTETNFALQSFKTEYNMPQATDAIVKDYILNPKDNRQSTYSGSVAPANTDPGY
jgi:hypothetical protein